MNIEKRKRKIKVLKSLQDKKITLSEAKNQIIQIDKPILLGIDADTFEKTGKIPKGFCDASKANSFIEDYD